MLCAPQPQERAALLVARARKLRKKGDFRACLVAMREACALAEYNAAWWMLYGAWLLQAGRQSEAERAAKQALWLRRQTGDERRARVIRGLLLRIQSQQGCCGRGVRAPLSPPWRERTIRPAT